jgi:hypothetical protein
MSPHLPVTSDISSIGISAEGFQIRFVFEEPVPFPILPALSLRNLTTLQSVKIKTGIIYTTVVSAVKELCHGGTTVVFARSRRYIWI